MTDFAAMIDRVIERQTRGRLARFVASYEHVEFGRKRKLDAEEIALVLVIIDTFLCNDSVTTPAGSELNALCQRLGMHAAQEDVFPCPEGVGIRNACFDALNCVRTLEARVAGLVDQHAARRVRRWSRPVPAND